MGDSPTLAQETANQPAPAEPRVLRWVAQNRQTPNQQSTAAIADERIDKLEERAASLIQDPIKQAEQILKVIDSIAATPAERQGLIPIKQRLTQLTAAGRNIAALAEKADNTANDAELAAIASAAFKEQARIFTVIRQLTDDAKHSLLSRIPAEHRLEVIPAITALQEDLGRAASGFNQLAAATPAGPSAPAQIGVANNALTMIEQAFEGLNKSTAQLGKLAAMMNFEAKERTVVALEQPFGPVLTAAAVSYKHQAAAAPAAAAMAPAPAAAAPAPQSAAPAGAQQERTLEQSTAELGRFLAQERAALEKGVQACDALDAAIKKAIPQAMPGTAFPMTSMFTPGGRALINFSTMLLKIKEDFGRLSAQSTKVQAEINAGGFGVRKELLGYLEAERDVMSRMDIFIRSFASSRDRYTGNHTERSEYLNYPDVARLVGDTTNPGILRTNINDMIRSNAALTVKLQAGSTAAAGREMQTHQLRSRTAYDSLGALVKAGYLAEVDIVNKVLQAYNEGTINQGSMKVSEMLMRKQILDSSTPSLTQFNNALRDFGQGK